MPRFSSPTFSRCSRAQLISAVARTSAVGHDRADAAVDEPDPGSDGRGPGPIEEGRSRAGMIHPVEVRFDPFGGIYRMDRFWIGALSAGVGHDAARLSLGLQVRAVRISRLQCSIAMDRAL